jgi:hypothetical protein
MDKLQSLLCSVFPDTTLALLASLLYMLVLVFADPTLTLLASLFGIPVNVDATLERLPSRTRSPDRPNPELARLPAELTPVLDDAMLALLVLASELCTPDLPDT